MQVIVKNLFGRFNYEIETKNDGLTILTGPNGYGKSTILRIIYGVSEGLPGMEQFFKIDFESIIIKNEENEFIITKMKEKVYINGIEVPSLYPSNSIIRYSEKYHNDERNNYYIVDENDDYDSQMPLINTYRDVTYDNLGGRRVYSKKLTKNQDNIIQKMKNMFSSVYFIKEQRLIKSRNIQRHPQTGKVLHEVIDDLPKKIKRRILQISNIYSEVSTKLDSSYPMRLFENKNDITEDEFVINSNRIKEQYSKLSKYALTSNLTFTDLKYEKEYSKALKVYFDDFNQKYNVYEPLIENLDLFTSIINDRLIFKKIEINKENGLIVKDDKGSEIELNQLSSGEKQEIVLFYELIFEVNDNSLLLIDEPEISLHIAWQKMFAEDLLKITLKKNQSVIIATHSPYIINNRWDNQIDLGKLSNELNSK